MRSCACRDRSAGSALLRPSRPRQLGRPIALSKSGQRTVCHACGSVKSDCHEGTAEDSRNTQAPTAKFGCRGPQRGGGARASASTGRPVTHTKMFEELFVAPLATEETRLGLSREVGRIEGFGKEPIVKTGQLRTVWHRQEHVCHESRVHAHEAHSRAI